MEEIVIEDVLFWMDGGTITLRMSKKQSILYEVEFVQKVFLEKSKRDYIRATPGSLRLNGEDVEIRSKLERELLLGIRIAEFGMNIAKNERDSMKKIILEAIDFVESEDYIATAKKVGRIN